LTAYAILFDMDKRKKNKKQDINVLAYNIVQETTEEDLSNDPTKNPSSKNPAAVALGRLGGLKGGPARAKKLTEQQRKEIARKAAKSRWAKK